jgi:predicted DNA-binding transcriptional regulator YafY
LETLRAAGVPLKFDAQAQRYSIPHGTFGPPDDLTAEEALAIWALANSAGTEPPLPLYEAAHTALTKLERSLPGPVRKKFRRTTRSIRLLPLKVASLSAKSTVYQSLVEAIEKRRTVEMEYSSLTEWECITTRLRPYQLLFCQHSWYVIGRLSLHRDIRIFNLARIVSLKLSNQKFSIPKSFNLEQRLRNAWNMIPEPGTDSHVVVKFGSLVARNVAEVTWHKTQRTRFLPDGSMLDEVTVSGLNEISWWILGYGDQAEVIRPAKLRCLISQRARKMAAMYDEKGVVDS